MAVALLSRPAESLKKQFAMCDLCDGGNDGGGGGWALLTGPPSSKNSGDYPGFSYVWRGRGAGASAKCHLCICMRHIGKRAAVHLGAG